MISFETAWKRIESHAGEDLTQVRGDKFTYEVSDGHIKPDRTNQQIPKSHFEEAFSLCHWRIQFQFSIFADHRTFTQS